MIIYRHTAAEAEPCCISHQELQRLRLAGLAEERLPSCATISMATKRFEEMLAFLQALKDTSESGTVAATQEKMMRGCLKDLELGPAVSMAAAQAMLEKLGKAGLPTGMQSAIAAAISSKVATPDAEAAEPEAQARKPKKGQQCHRYLHHFLRESDWKSLQGSVAFQAKQQTLAKGLVAMGLTNPTEGTYVLGVAVLYLSQHAGPAEKLQVSPQDALNTLEELKVKVRAWAKRGTHSGLSEYPRTPKELPEQLYRAAFAVEGPANCPLDEDQLVALADWLPARKSKATLLATKHARSLFQGMPSLAQQQMWMMQAQMQAAQGHGDDSLLPGLTFLPRRARQPKALQNASSASVSPEKGADSQTAPAEELPAEKPAGETGMLQKQPQLALPAPQADAAPEAGEAVDRMAEEVQEHLQNKLNKRKEPSHKDDKPSKAAKAPKAAPKKKTEPKPKQADTARKAKGAATKLPTNGSTEAKDPITLEKCSVYTCPNSQNWRVRLHGERKDKAFSWKSGAAEAWARLKAYVHGL